MATTKLAKKLPKRVGNANSKARRARNWIASERRKEARRKAQEIAHARNVERGYTTWEKVKEARYASRH